MTALDACHTARRAWERQDQQQQLDLHPDALNEPGVTATIAPTPPARLIEDAVGSGGRPLTAAEVPGRFLGSAGANTRLGGQTTAGFVPASSLTTTREAGD